MPARRLHPLFAAALLLVAGACALFEPSVPADAVQSHRGIWIGKSNIDTVGSVSVHRTGDGTLILIEDTFEMPPVGSVIVGLSRDGRRPEAGLGSLRRIRGRSIYRVPDDLRIEDFNEVWLWDTDLGRPVGVARLVKV